MCIMFVAASLAGLHGPAAAEVTFKWALIGNPGNAPDAINEDEHPRVGAVEYIYRISRYEVTNGQYVEFLNAVAATDANGLFNEEMNTDPRGGITQNGSSGSFTYSLRANMGNKPVNFVSVFDMMRFVNWLHNGQPIGMQDESTTEDGVYALSDGVSATRSIDAKYFIPTNNEWYKAAYHQPFAQGGDADDYWLYPTVSNSVPTNATANATGDIANPGANVANYDRMAIWNGKNANVTSVGSAGPLSESFYGTSDQGGNVLEWIEAAPFGRLRGGAWFTYELQMRSSFLGNINPLVEHHDVGFRIASPASTCSADLDDDGDVDLVDYAEFQVQVTGPQ